MDNFLYIYYFIMGRVRRLYFMAVPENKQEFKTSRKLFTVDGATSQMIIQLVGGAFIASLISNLGIDDSLNGIIASFSVLACFFQPIATILTKNLKKFKLFVCITAITHRLLFSFIFFIPFLNISGQAKIAIFVVAFLLGHVFLQIGIPAAQDWIASLVPQKLRGKYFAIRDLIGVMSFAVITLIAGIILDKYEADNNMITGFFIIGSIVFLLALINIIALSNIKEPKIAYENRRGKEPHGRLLKKLYHSHGTDFISDMKSAFHSRPFKKVIILNTMWQVILFFTTTYNALYQIKELNLKYTFIMTIGLFVNLTRTCVTPFWGRLGDKYGMARILKYSFATMAVYNLLMVFTVPENAFFMLPAALIFSGIAWGFVGIGMLGVQLDYLPGEKRISYLSINAAIGGICGFLASVLGGEILKKIQELKPVLFGRQIYAQQFINAIAVLLLILLIIYIKFAIQKETKIVSTTDGIVKK